MQWFGASLMSRRRVRRALFKMRKVPQIDFSKMYQLFWKCHDTCHSPLAAVASDMSNVTVIFTGSAIKN